MTPVLFSPAGLAQLANALPETRAAESKLRAIASAAGIVYKLPDYAGLRTPADTARLIGYRNSDVAKARAAAESKARLAGKTAAQIAAAGAAAANEAFYRVSPYNTGFHGIGGAFDIAITSTPKGMSSSEAYAYLGARAKECGLRWGGAFKDDPSTAIVEKPDPYHFELDQPRLLVEAKWKAYAATNVVKDNIGKGGAAPVIVALVIVGGVIAYHLVKGKSSA